MNVYNIRSAAGTLFALKEGKELKAREKKEVGLLAGHSPYETQHYETAISRCDCCRYLRSSPIRANTS